MGDLATTISFQLAKDLKMSPMDITSNIMENIEILDIFEKVEAKGPYINFFLLIMKHSQEGYLKLLEVIMESFHLPIKRLFWNILQQILMVLFT